MKCKFKNMECPHAGKLTYMGDPLFGETPGLHEETICYNDEIGNHLNVKGNLKIRL